MIKLLSDLIYCFIKLNINNLVLLSLYNFFLYTHFTVVSDASRQWLTNCRSIGTRELYIISRKYSAGDMRGKAVQEQEPSYVFNP